LVSYGSFEIDYLARIASSVKSEFQLPVNFTEKFIDLSVFYDPTRRQYDGNKLLKQIDNEYGSSKDKTIGLFHVDLFIPILTFIFGQAILQGKAGIVSSYRLKNELYGMPRNEDLLFNRFLKIIIHELGHAFGLIHCHIPTCVMRPGTYVEDIDQKKHTLCPKCRGILKIVVTR